MQKVGGHGLVLLLDEAERREREARILAVAILKHGGELVAGAPGLTEKKKKRKKNKDKIDICSSDFESFLPPEECLGSYEETKRLKMVVSVG